LSVGVRPGVELADVFNVGGMLNGTRLSSNG